MQHDDQTDYAVCHSVLGNHLVLAIGTWLLAALSMLISQDSNSVLTLVGMVLALILWCASVYWHMRLHTDGMLLSQLAKKEIDAEHLSAALMALKLRRKPLCHTAQSRCLACLRLWRQSLVIDSTLMLLSLMMILKHIF